MHRGKLAILLMLLVAIGLGGLSLWVRHRQGKRALEFWGVADAQRIRHATEVELVTLQAGEGIGRHLLLDEQPFRVIDEGDISAAPGLVHARHSLLVDHNFVWERADECTPRWSFALRFVEGDQATVVVFDTNCQRVRCLATGQDLVLIKPLADAWELRSRTWLGQPARPLESSSPAGSPPAGSPPADSGPEHP